ncbi:cytokine receptor common subunit gamma-like isoform X1 [Lepisosteus oculatus]|uniref:cytokine receptor common subunit gamma-like isoform X1 n=1 Tax=Lepisosteus oculatus TaxID=7918 RepID=UPI003720C300
MERIVALAGLLFAVGCWNPGGAADEISVACLIPNEEHISCTWSKKGTPRFNYTFHSRLRRLQNYTECPLYLQKGGYNVGCQLPYTSNLKFYTLYARLAAGNSSAAWETGIELNGLVVLSPPHNVTLKVSSSSGPWLYWNVSSKVHCVESQVRYRNGDDAKWQVSKTIRAPFEYKAPLLSTELRAAFQVRARISMFCGKSKHWSKWSPTLSWESTRPAAPRACAAFTSALSPLILIGWLAPVGGFLIG